MIKKKPNPKTYNKSKWRKVGETAGAIVTVVIVCFLAVYKILPEIRSTLLTKEEAQKTSDYKSNIDSEKHFDVKALTNSSVNVITSNNSNVAVNSNNVIGTNNVVNSNNKIDQKIDNNFREDSKIINNYSSPVTQQPKYKPQIVPESNQTPNQQPKIQQQTQLSVVRNSSIEDPNIENYFAVIESHRNRGVDLAKCNSVQLCLELYNNWQNQANNLLTEVDNYLRQNYRRRSELQQQFGNETFDGRIFPATKASLESIQSVFFNRADLFGMIGFKLKNSLTEKNI